MTVDYDGSGGGGGDETTTVAGGIALHAIISSFVLKVTTSIDDLLWLSPFLSLSTTADILASRSSRSRSKLFCCYSNNDKLKYSIIYFCICTFVTMISYIFGTSLLPLMNKLFTSGEDDNNNDDGYHYWNVERILSIFSFLVLLIFARKDYIEWKGEENNNNGNGTTLRMIEEGVGGGGGVNNRNNKSSNIGNRIKEIEMEKLVSSSSSLQQQQQQTRSRSTRSSWQSTTSSHSTNSYDDYNDRNDDRTINDIEDSNNKENDINSAERNANVNETSGSKIDDASSKSIRRFIIVCIMGTFDDMIVFSAFVAGSTSSSTSSNSSTTTADTKKTTNINNFIELFIGTTFAALLIILLSWGCSEIHCFKQLITKIPMWLLMTGIALYILIMGLL